jgi:hypothetical protein
MILLTSGSSFSINVHTHATASYHAGSFCSGSLRRSSFLFAPSCCHASSYRESPCCMYDVAIEAEKEHFQDWNLPCELMANPSCMKKSQTDLYVFIRLIWGSWGTKVTYFDPTLNATTIINTCSQISSSYVPFICGCRARLCYTCCGVVKSIWLTIITARLSSEPWQSWSLLWLTYQYICSVLLQMEKLGGQPPLNFGPPIKDSSCPNWNFVCVCTHLLLCQ